MLSRQLCNGVTLRNALLPPERRAGLLPPESPCPTERAAHPIALHRGMTYVRIIRTIANDRAGASDRAGAVPARSPQWGPHES
jgi:hypothetical protein